MTTLTASQARIKLYKLLDTVAKSHQPVEITGRRNKAYLVSDEDWNALQETVYLTSIPGMRESIIKGMKTAVKKLSKRLNW